MRARYDSAEIQAALKRVVAENPGIRRKRLYDQVQALVPHSKPAAMGQHLRFLLLGGIVIENEDRFTLGSEPVFPTPVQTNPETERVEIAPYTMQRQEFTVTVEQSFDFRGVRFEIQKDGVWIKIARDGGLRIHIGGGVPEWSPNQETEDQVNAYRITGKDGRAQTFSVPAGHLVTYLVTRKNGRD